MQKCFHKGGRLDFLDIYREVSSRILQDRAEAAALENSRAKGADRINSEKWPHRKRDALGQDRGKKSYLKERKRELARDFDKAKGPCVRGSGGQPNLQRPVLRQRSATRVGRGALIKELPQEKVKTRKRRMGKKTREVFHTSVVPGEKGIVKLRRVATKESRVKLAAYTHPRRRSRHVGREGQRKSKSRGGRGTELLTAVDGGYQPAASEKRGRVACKKDNPAGTNRGRPSGRVTNENSVLES